MTDSRHKLYRIAFKPWIFRTFEFHHQECQKYHGYAVIFLKLEPKNLLQFSWAKIVILLLIDSSSNNVDFDKKIADLNTLLSSTIRCMISDIVRMSSYLRFIGGKCCNKSWKLIEMCIWKFTVNYRVISSDHRHIMFMFIRFIFHVFNYGSQTCSLLFSKLHVLFNIILKIQWISHEVRKANV